MQLRSRLLLYGDLGEDSILDALCRLWADWERGDGEVDSLRRRLLDAVKRLLDLATEYGFDENLWANYLSFLLMTNENSFSLCRERQGELEGSVNHFARRDFDLFYQLLHFDFTPLERALEVDCFTVLQSYRAVTKRERCYNHQVSQAVQALSRDLMAAKDGGELFDRVTRHYRDVGVGLLGHNRAFRVQEQGTGIMLLPVHNTEQVKLSDLVGYELQKEQLRGNVEAFLEGRGANNMLLYGDSGTGKSTSVKALLNEYHHRGLRVIELYKHQFRLLSAVIGAVKNRNYRFLVFIDDLSFEENEVEYKFLKAVIEGGVETRPANLLICATSNRRHLIRETWDDRTDTQFTGDIHRSDTVEEKLSLSSRFGLQINYSIPKRELFLEMVEQLAARRGLTVPREELFAQANRWELRHGGISGRTAQQFINHLSGHGGGA